MSRRGSVYPIESMRYLASLFVLGASLLLPELASAACHVVRAGAPANGTGGDWSQAYAELPKSLIRGDVYYVAAGTYGAHTFADADSGALTIEVRSATPSDHCSDVGWNASYAGQAVFAPKSGSGSIFDFNTDYYVVNGQSRGADWKSGYGIKLDDTGKGACVADVSGGLGGKAVHDITVEYVEIDGSHATADACNEQGVEFVNGSHDLLFRALWNHDVGNTNFFLKGGGGAQNITIEQSWMADNYSSPAIHGEGCSCSEGLQNFTVRDNHWVDMIGTAYMATPSGSGYKTGNDNNGPWYIHGNVFSATPGHHHCAVGDGVLAAFDVSFSGALYFVNNTIAGINQKECGTGLDSSGIQFGVGFKAGFTNVFVQNNLWWNVDQISTVTACDNTSVFCSAIAWDHNAYFQIVDGSVKNDPDTNAQVVAVDPFTGSSSSDFRLAQATSAGVTLNVAGQTLATDPVGAPRGLDGVWDRGAFEFAKCSSDKDCKVADACHVAGTCGASGVCSSPAAPDGTVCPSGRCATGVCVPGSDGGAGADAGSASGSSAPSDGCGCTAGRTSDGGAFVGGAALVLLVLRRRRRS